MRSSRLVVLWSLVMFAPLGLAQKGPGTEVEQDGLKGAVKSVATIAESPDVQWAQPSGPTLVFPVVCHDCQYSPDGYRTKSGQIAEGKFLGVNINLNRDVNGRVTGLVATNADNGAVFRRAVLGPFGKTEEEFYQNGAVTVANTLRYDPNGHVTESISSDGAGGQVERTLTTWNKDDWTERTTWGKDQLIRARETYDPVKDEQRFSAFDESGSAAVNWTYSHGEVPAFWEASDAPNQFGNGFSDFTDKANPTAFHCHRGGICDVAKIHYTYADAAKRNPLSAEWRDANGLLQYGAYYTYRFDSAGNWTHREISVYSADLGARTLYETDDRIITYWDK